MVNVPLKSSNQRSLRKVRVSLECWLRGVLAITAVVIGGVESHHDLVENGNNK